MQNRFFASRENSPTGDWNEMMQRKECKLHHLKHTLSQTISSQVAITAVISRQQ